MKTRELMMGNLIQIEGNPVEVIKIFEIHLEVHSDIFQFWHVEIEEVEPISLTEEWLMKFGFKQSPTSNSCFYIVYKQLDLILYKTDTPIAVSNDFKLECFYYFFNKVAVIIEYAHQIQNLFFSLTQTELTIKDL